MIEKIFGLTLLTSVIGIAVTQPNASQWWHTYKDTASKIIPLSTTCEGDGWQCNIDFKRKVITFNFGSNHLELNYVRDRMELSDDYTRQVCHEHNMAFFYQFGKPRDYHGFDFRGWHLQIMRNRDFMYWCKLDPRA